MYKGNTLDDINRKKICKKLLSYYIEGGNFIEECIDIQEEASFDFYKPTKQQGHDHYNNKTIIL